MIVLQAESEVASINMVYGGAGAGARVMTSSSSPGISLMQEGLSYIACAELPCLDRQRQPGRARSRHHPAVAGGLLPGGQGGRARRLPSDRPRAVERAGDGGFRLRRIRSCRQVPQSGHDPGRRCARTDDGEGGIPRLRSRRHIRRQTLGDDRQAEDPGTEHHHVAPHRAGEDGADQPPPAGEVPPHRGERRRGASSSTPTTPNISIVAYGLAARIAQGAVEMARAQGISVGLLRPITLFPFPSRRRSANSPNGSSGILVVEMNAGQMVEDVRLAVEGRVPVSFYGRMGGIIPSPDEVAAARWSKLVTERRCTTTRRRTEMEPDH